MSSPYWQIFFPIGDKRRSATPHSLPDISKKTAGFPPPLAAFPTNAERLFHMAGNHASLFNSELR